MDRCRRPLNLLFVTNLSNAINATLYERLNFDFMRDMLPVAGIAQAPSVLAISSSVPAMTVTELIAHAKANPGRINMGSAGIGSTGHLAGELFKMMAGVDLIHVPYRGNAPALTDLMAGQIEAAGAGGNRQISPSGPIGHPIGLACSISFVTRRISGSSSGGATICNPTGSLSSVSPAGTLQPGASHIGRGRGPCGPVPGAGSSWSAWSAAQSNVVVRDLETICVT